MIGFLQRQNKSPLRKGRFIIFAIIHKVNATSAKISVKLIQHESLYDDGNNAK